MILSQNNRPVIGIDASLTSTGFCILYEDVKNMKLLAVKGGKLRGAERLAYFQEQLVYLLTEYTPKFALIENYAYSVGVGGRVFDVGELGGVVRLTLFQQSVPYDVVAPPSVKKYITGSGRCEKDVIIKEVYKNYGIDTNDNNLADAVVIAKIAESIWKKRNDVEVKLKKYEKEVVDKIMKEVV